MQKANPGGTLAPNEVIGRDKLVAQLWGILERQSLYITAERRMGKTSVVRDKMAKSPINGWKLIYIDVSKAVTPLQFVEALLNASFDYLTGSNQTKFVVFGLLNKLAGFDIKAGIGIKLPEKLGPDWKTVLSTMMRDLANSDKRIVIAFDELPLMLDAFKRREGRTSGEQIVMEMLYTLRASRQ